MIRRLIYFLTIFVLWTVLGVISKPVFMAVHHGLMQGADMSATLPVMWHGLRLDLAIAGYLTVIPALLLIATVWTRNARKLRLCWMVYFALAAFVYVAAVIVNIVMYAFWGFPLDATPLFYVFTSPAEAFASVSIWFLLAGVLAMVALAAVVAWLLMRALPDFAAIAARRERIVASCVLVVMTGMLFIPIRGGFTVAANNVSSVYFSNNIRLNHAAVNPLFSFFESVSHSENFSKQYRYLDDSEATDLFSNMTYTEMRQDALTDTLLTQHFRDAVREQRANVVIVVLESFSTYIMDAGGNVTGVVPTINRLTQEGIYFSNFYANSFRTDRGLMAILSGYPAQPTTSLCKYPKKTNDLFAVSRSLQHAGYSTHYVFGGDANFTNRRSWLMASGFEDIIDMDSYPSDIERGKWGVNDAELFKRALSEMAEQQTGNRFFTIQTSSSHEPFEVPYDGLKNERLNAFQYSDRELGRYIDGLKSHGAWDNTLLLVVADHLGCYPEQIDNYQFYRYQIPCIITGGAVAQPVNVGTLASQMDIAATLLAMVGVDHSDFIFSKDIFDARAPHFAFFDFPDAMGLVTDNCQLIYDNLSKKTLVAEGSDIADNVKRAQAYLQKIYDDIASR